MYGTPKFHGENFCGWLYNREIRECFLPQKFSAIRYMYIHIASSQDSLSNDFGQNWYIGYMICIIITHTLYNCPQRIFIISILTTMVHECQLPRWYSGALNCSMIELEREIPHCNLCPLGPLSLPSFLMLCAASKILARESWGQGHMQGSPIPTLVGSGRFQPPLSNFYHLSGLFYHHSQRVKSAEVLCLM